MGTSIHFRSGRKAGGEKKFWPKRAPHCYSPVLAQIATALTDRAGEVQESNGRRNIMIARRIPSFFLGLRGACLKAIISSLPSEQEAWLF